MPRRAMLHRYPLIGRFAAFARKEEHLWSIRSGPVRRAFYAGSILSLLPLMGVQLLVGLALAIVTRANYMIIGALQFITNPFTAVPIYGATFFLGRSTLGALGLELRGARLPEGWHSMKLGEILHHLGWGSAITDGLLCLVVGGVLSGVILGAVLDGVYYLGLRTAQTAVEKPASPDATVTHHDPS